MTGRSSERQRPRYTMSGDVVVATAAYGPREGNVVAIALTLGLTLQRLLSLAREADQ
jgi:hypothetical protein